MPESQPTSKQESKQASKEGRKQARKQGSMQARIFSSTLKFIKLKNLRKIQKVINLQTATLKHQQAKTTHPQTLI